MWRGELKIEVLLSTKISSPLQFHKIYPPFQLFLIHQQLYLFQIKLDFSKLQLDLLKINESFPQSWKFNCICFEEAFVKKIKVKYFFSIFCQVDNWLYSTTLVPFIVGVLIRSTPKKGVNLTDSSQCHLRGKPSTHRLASSASGYLATSSLTLGLKLHSVHFAYKFSSALQARLRRTWLQSAPCAVSIQVHPSSCLSSPLLTSSGRWTQTLIQVYFKLSQWSFPPFQENFI